MKLLRATLRSVNGGFYHRQFNRSVVSSTSTNSNSGPNNQFGSSNDSNESFQNRIFDGRSGGTSSSFSRMLDGRGNARTGQGMNSNVGGYNSGLFSGNDESFTSSLADGLDGKLKNVATCFEVNPEEIAAEDYTYRPDVNLKSGVTYTPEDLNIRKPGVWRPSKRMEFEVTTKEALEKADFRNVKFLAHFITEAGIIVKRSKTGISAKAQRKIAREIKTARAFGLLPFTTMGTKAFVFGKTMKDLDTDFEPDIYDARSEADDVPDPLAG